MDGTYWAYATGSAGRNLQVISSSDLRRWSGPADPLPELPAWAGRGFTWAPEVLALGDRFVLYYTVRDAASGRQCISVATSASPAGPFADGSSGPLVHQLDHLGSIDPSPFVVDGCPYLLWKSEDNAAGRPTHLWACPLSPDGLSFVGPEAHLLSQTGRWQRPAMEGPTMMAAGGRYHLFYGAGDWASASAGIGWATCAGPLGPCTDHSTRRPWARARRGARGASGPATFTDRTGVSRFAYHAWTGASGYERGGARSLFLGALSFTRRGRPKLGPLPDRGCAG